MGDNDHIFNVAPNIQSSADIGLIGSPAEACVTQINRIPDAEFFTHVTSLNVRQGHRSKWRSHTCPQEVISHKSTIYP